MIWVSRKQRFRFFFHCSEIDSAKLPITVLTKIVEALLDIECLIWTLRANFNFWWGWNTKYVPSTEF